jgi:hypothetical protein
VHILALAVLTPVGAMKRAVFQVQKGGKMGISLEIHGSPISAVPAIGAAEGNVLFPAEADTPLSPIAGLYMYFYIIYKHSVKSELKLPVAPGDLLFRGSFFPVGILIARKFQIQMIPTDQAKPQSYGYDEKDENKKENDAGNDPGRISCQSLNGDKERGKNSGVKNTAQQIESKNPGNKKPGFASNEKQCADSGKNHDPRNNPVLDLTLLFSFVYHLFIIY